MSFKRLTPSGEKGIRNDSSHEMLGKRGSCVPIKLLTVNGIKLLTGRLQPHIHTYRHTQTHTHTIKAP
jgi:hypothetical protein